MRGNCQRLIEPEFELELASFKLPRVESTRSSSVGAWLERGILPGGHERLCPMSLRILSTARSSAICLVLRGRVGFEELVPIFECASVRLLELIVGTRSAAIRRGSERIMGTQN